MSILSVICILGSFCCLLFGGSVVAQPAQSLQTVGEFLSLTDPHAIVTHQSGFKQYAYVADGDGGLKVLDVTHPDSLILVGYLGISSAQDLAIFATTAYVAASNGLIIVDISNPVLPIAVGSVSTATQATHVAVLGGLAFVTNGHSLLIVNIGNPASPQLQSVTLISGASAVIALDAYAYVAGKNGLTIVDASNPASPTIEKTTVFLYGASDIAIAEVNGATYVIVVTPYGSTIVNVTSAAQPSTVAMLNQCFANAVSVWREYAILATLDGLRVLDLSGLPIKTPLTGLLSASFVRSVVTSSDGTLAYVVTAAGVGTVAIANWALSPKLLGTTPLIQPQPMSAFVQENVACVVASSGGTDGDGDENGDGSTGSLQLVNVTDSSSPTLLGRVSLAQGGYSVFVQGDIAYVATCCTPNYQGSLVFVNVANPMNPITLGNLTLNQAATAVFVLGATAYVSILNGYIVSGGLLLVDITNPKLPRNISTTVFSEPAYGVVVHGNIAYVVTSITEYGGGTNGHLHLVNIANPASPTFSSFSLPLGGGNDVFVQGTIAYVSTSSNYGSVGFMQLVDVTNITHPKSLNGISLSEGGNCVYVEGNIAYVGTSAGLQLVNVANYNALTLLGIIPVGANGVFVRGTTAYVSTESSLQLVKVAHEIPSTLVGSTSFAGSVGLGDKAVYVLGNIAYILVGGQTGLQLVDVTNPASPKPLGSYFFTQPHSVFVQGTIAYVTTIGSDDEGHLQLVDVTDPSSPWQIITAVFANWCFGVFVQDSIAYVATNYGLELVDVSHPYSDYFGSLQLPRLGTCQVGRARDVIVQNHIAYVTANRRLQLINASNPLANVLPQLGHVEFAQDAQYVFVQDNVAFVWAGGLQVVNVTDPLNPVTLANVTAAGRSIFVQRSTVYIVGDALHIVSVADPAAPMLVSSVWIPLMGRSVFAQDTTVYVLALNDGGGTANGVLELYDVGPAPMLLQLSDTSLMAANVFSVQFANNRAYVGGSDGLRVIDASNPSAPQRTFSLSLFGDVLGMSVRNDILHAAINTSNGGGCIQLVDISDPNSLKPLGSLNLTFAATSVAVNGNNAYVGVASLHSGNGVLYVVDVSNSLTLRITGTIAMSAGIHGVAVADSYAFLATSDGLAIVDCSNSNGPVIQKATLTFATGALDIVVSSDGNTAYIAASWDGLQIVDVSKPSTPKKIGSFPVPSGAVGISIEGNYVFVAANSGGLLVIDVSDSNNPVLATNGAFNSFVAADVAVSGGYVYLIGGGVLEIIDVSRYFPGRLSLLAWFKLNGIYLGTAAGILGGLTTFSAVVWNSCLKERCARDGGCGLKQLSQHLHPRNWPCLKCFFRTKDAEGLEMSTDF